MAVTLTQAELSAAIRLGDSAEENAEAARLLAFATEAITRHLGDAYETTPEAIVNEAGIRLAAYLFDMPNAGRGLSFANAGRNSGAWTILLPYRIHRAGSTDDALAAAQEAVGSTVNPVVGVTLTADELVITFADGSVETTPFTPGGGSGVDQIARDTAATAQADLAAHEATLHNTDTLARSTAVDARQVGEAAQATADALRTELETHEGTPHGGGGGADQTARDAAATAQADLDAHEASTHNTDQTARTAAANARATAEQSQADLDAHEATPHNFDTIARDAAANAQSAIDDHERAPHNTDGAARTAAAAAQARADDAYTLADGKVDSSGAAAAAREVTVDWAEADNPDPIPAPKLVNVINAHVDIANVLDGRLPGLPIVMRLGWSQSRMFTELDFDRPLPPIGGSISGMSGGLVAPTFPPGIAGDPTLFLGIWLAGDPDVAELPAGFAVADKSAITVGGAAGVYFASTERLPASVAGDVFKVFLVGDRIVTESDLDAHVGDPVAHHTPPTGSMGGGPAVLYEATAAIGTAAGLIAGSVACPETGELEFYFEGLTGTRQGAVAYARIPTARIRGAVSALAANYSNDSANLLAIPARRKPWRWNRGASDYQLFDVERASAG